MHMTAAKARSSAQELPITVNARKRMLEFYRERDREDARRCASGQQRTRGLVYAEGIERLEGGGDVYESYKLIRAAGIELSARTESLLAALPQDWRQVCRIDADGRVWTASLREKKSSW